MISLSKDAIQGLVSQSSLEKIAEIRVFDEIDSTNSFLMQMPGPAAGAMKVAATCNQTAGRGRHGNTWQSPPGSGVCLSASYTFASRPEDLSALTLAIGLQVVRALEALGAAGVEIKWPNDLVADDRKLGGILTEVHSQRDGSVTIVSGVGINVDLDDALELGATSEWAGGVIDLCELCDELPLHDVIAAKLTEHFLTAFASFEDTGVRGIISEWPTYDWLLRRELVLDTGGEMVSGKGAGIDHDGALLIDTGNPALYRVMAGTIVKVGKREHAA